MKNMSFSLTERQFLAGEKDVTRRLGWKSLKIGDRVRAVRKAMGLKKGENIVVLGVIRIVSVRREKLGAITHAECAREGFGDMNPAQFCEMFASHMEATPETVVTRIEFKRVADETGA